MSATLRRLPSIPEVARVQPGELLDDDCVVLVAPRGHDNVGVGIDPEARRQVVIVAIHGRLGRRVSRGVGEIGAIVHDRHSPPGESGCVGHSRPNVSAPEHHEARLPDQRLGEDLPG